MAKALMDSTFDDVLGNVFDIAKISRKKLPYLLLLKVQLALNRENNKIVKKSYDKGNITGALRF